MRLRPHFPCRWRDRVWKSPVVWRNGLSVTTLNDGRHTLQIVQSALLECEMVKSNQFQQRVMMSAREP